MSQLRVALVGSGSMGMNHARVIATSIEASLAVVIDPNRDVGTRAADRYGASWAPDLDALAGVDAAVLAAPTEFHFDLAMSIIEAGLPLLIEKPVCPSLEQTRLILAASEARGSVLMCGLLERFNPAVLAAMEMVDSPRYVRAERHSPYVPRVKTGVAWDLLVHDVDLVVRFLGGLPPEEVDVSIGHYHPLSLPTAEDVVETTLRFPQGEIASVSASRLGQRKVRSFVVHDIDRMIEIDLLRRGVTAYRHATIEGDEGRGGFLILLVGSFDHHPLVEDGAGADEGDEVRCVERPPPLLSGFDEFEGHSEASGPRPGSFGDLGP